jgi:hypothetical protein
VTQKRFAPSHVLSPRGQAPFPTASEDQGFSEPAVLRIQPRTVMTNNQRGANQRAYNWCVGMDLKLENGCARRWSAVHLVNLILDVLLDPFVFGERLALIA